ncbi:hypothetical protein EVAR_13109_1 [Eumeta japonica]|uniref:Uncharacterized protein n=1 Tax=Eumeta variegata TaxID=151549 RepID=A0A4C1UAF3_EUMVA|nr:hypothetical protein EVAR_13109_1 [Eumeta japonica]
MVIPKAPRATYVLGYGAYRADSGERGVEFPTPIVGFEQVSIPIKRLSCGSELPRSCGGRYAVFRAPTIAAPRPAKTPAGGNDSRSLQADGSTITVRPLANMALTVIDLGVFGIRLYGGYFVYDR